MRIKGSTILLLGLLFAQVNFAQMADCTLGLGGKDTEVIIKVFHLNEEQKSQLDMWVAEYQLSSRLIQEEVDQLLESHPQKTPEDLEKLAVKYNTLKTKLFNISRAYDQQLIALFDQRQYGVYLELCNEVNRKPISKSANEH
ncbi:MAG: hypothetical protein HKP60_09110 [Eudoraea sp.]|nr:hypothetical protein [Eudoraea sp.]NNJ41014.1 hypothetical protein [Eudoraea sp.]